MEVKKCDRCGRIIENEDNWMDLRGDEVVQGVNGRFRKAFEIRNDLCEDSMNELKRFMEGKEEPETEAPAETKGTSKFVDMVLQMREMIKWCDVKNDCTKCPLYKLNEDEDMICGDRCVTDFVREFIIEAAKDPIVKALVLRKCVDANEYEEFAADDALEQKCWKLAKKLCKAVHENRYSDVYKMEDEPEEESKEEQKEEEKPVIEVRKVDFNEIMEDQELHDLFWLALIFGLANGMGSEEQKDE